MRIITRRSLGVYVEHVSEQSGDSIGIDKSLTQPEISVWNIVSRGHKDKDVMEIVGARFVTHL